MPWFKLDDNGWCHPKVLASGNRAFGAWCRAGQWSSQQLSNGFVPASVCRLIEPATSVWRALEVSGLMHRCDDGYTIHDYLEYNPSKSQVEAKRSAQRAGGKAGAKARWDGLGDGSTHRVSHGSTHGGTHDESNAPVPSRPDPTRPIEKETQPALPPAPLTLTGMDAPDPDRKPLRKEPTGAHAEVVAHWCSAFEASRGVKYRFQAARDGASVKKLLGACDGDPAEAKRLVDNAFADEWWAERVTIGQIAGDPNKFATLKKTGPKVQPTSGRDWMATAQVNR